MDKLTENIYRLIKKYDTECQNQEEEIFIEYINKYKNIEGLTYSEIFNIVKEIALKMIDISNFYHKNELLDYINIIIEKTKENN